MMMRLTISSDNKTFDHRLWEGQKLPSGICDILTFPVSLADNLELDLAHDCIKPQAGLCLNPGRQCHMSNVGKGCSR